MKHVALVCITFGFLCGCATKPMVATPANIPLPMSQEPSLHDISVAELQTHLGLTRSPQSLGFEEKGFDGCRLGVKGESGGCGQRFLSVVHVRLVCRDTVGTTSRVPASLRPLVSSPMEWRLGGMHGNVRTDNQGFVQIHVVSSRPTKAERLIMIIGSKTLGIEAGEVSQIVLPGNWCARWASIDVPALSDFPAPLLISEK